MQDGNDYNAAEKTSLAGTGQSACNRIRMAAEQVRLQALSLFIIRSTVEKHGGIVEIDLATDSITITVPEKERRGCIREIEAQLEAMRL